MHPRIILRRRGKIICNQLCLLQTLTPLTLHFEFCKCLQVNAVKKHDFNRSRNAAKMGVPLHRSVPWLTLSQPAGRAQAIYCRAEGEAGFPGVPVEGLIPTAGLLSALAGAAVGFARSRGARQAAWTGLALRLLTTILATCLIRALSGAARQPVVTWLTEGSSRILAGASDGKTNGAGASSDSGKVASKAVSSGAAGGSATGAAVTAGAEGGAGAGTTAAVGTSGVGVGAVFVAPEGTGRSFSPTPFTKTVKTPGVSSTVNVPQRLGALTPSRSISSTLKLAARGFAWQSRFFLTQTWSQGRFANCFESLASPCASVIASSRQSLSSIWRWS
jgi:hypothetical protein